MPNGSPTGVQARMSMPASPCTTPPPKSAWCTGLVGSTVGGTLVSVRQALAMFTLRWKAATISIARARAESRWAVHSRRSALDSFGAARRALAVA
jgi:hypothetical protein